jgi:hypothetical protein
MGFLGGLLSGIVSKLVEWGLFGWLMKRSGKEAQHAADLEATNAQAREARQIDGDVAGLSDSQLDSELRGPGASH